MGVARRVKEASQRATEAPRRVTEASRRVTEASRRAQGSRDARRATDFRPFFGVTKVHVIYNLLKTLLSKQL